MKRLKTILRYENISGLLIYLAISVLLLYLSFLHLPLIFIYIIYIVFLYKKNRVLFYYSIFVSIIFFLIYLFNYLLFTNISAKDYIYGVITDRSENYFIVKEKTHYVKVYYENSNNLEIGKRIYVYGKEKPIVERNIQGVFSYYRYKLSKKIAYEYFLDSYRIKDGSFSIYILKGRLIKYIEETFSITSGEYLKRLVLGVRSFDEELSQAINATGIIFLFSISGLHISLLSRMIKNFFRLFNLEEEIISIIILIFMFFYLLIASSSVSILRSVIMIFINEIFFLLKKKISKTDCLSISFLVSLLINPFYIFEMGFFLTYLSTFVIFLNKENNYIKMSLYVSLFTMPLILYYNHEISFFIILSSIFFSLIFSEVFIPFTYIVLLFSPLDFIYKNMIEILNDLIYFFEDINIQLNISIQNVYFLLIIYLFLLLHFKNFKNKKSKMYGFLLLFSIFSSLFFSKYEMVPSITFIDCGQGDSILLRSGFKVILVDTGPVDNYHSTVSYLKSQNVNKIDYCFISHKDSDHFGEYDSIKSSIYIKNLCMELDSFNIKIANFNIKTYRLNSSNSNEQSMVLYIECFDTKILLTGDIEKEGENYIMTKDIQNIDILKVAHHGSNSSSQIEFLRKMNPKLSIISVGLNNSYGHPKKEVLDRLKEVDTKLFRTDISGTIKIKIHLFYKVIKTYRNDDIFIIDKLDNLSIIF